MEESEDGVMANWSYAYGQFPKSRLNYLVRRGASTTEGCDELRCVLPQEYSNLGDRIRIKSNILISLPRRVVTARFGAVSDDGCSSLDNTLWMLTLCLLPSIIL